MAVGTRLLESMCFLLNNKENTSVLSSVLLINKKSNFREFVFQIIFFISREEIFANQVFRDFSREYRKSSNKRPERLFNFSKILGGVY